MPRQKRIVEIMYQPTLSNSIEARAKLEDTIEQGAKSALALVEYLHNNIPEDDIRLGRELKFVPEVVNKRVEVKGIKNIPSAHIHKHALQQLSTRAGVPSAYLRALIEEEPASWKVELASDILNRHYSNGNAKDRMLLRCVNGELRANLSDRYRRLDSRFLVDAFCKSAKDIDAVPVRGHYSDTRVAVKALLRTVHEPIPGEPVCFGVEWGNSDFGAARHTIRAFILRLTCLNGATMENSLAQVHVGRTLDSDTMLSQRTYDYDTKTSASALDDVIRGTLAPERVRLLIEGIQAANAKDIDWRYMKGSLAKKLLKSEMQAVETAFESNDVHNMPAGKNMWRMSNAISWIAGHSKDEDRKLELQRLAGEVLNGKRDAEIREAL